MIRLEIVFDGEIVKVEIQGRKYFEISSFALMKIKISNGLYILILLPWPIDEDSLVDTLKVKSDSIIHWRIRASSHTVPCTLIQRRHSSDSS